MRRPFGGCFAGSWQLCQALQRGQPADQINVRIRCVAACSADQQADEKPHGEEAVMPWGVTAIEHNCSVERRISLDFEADDIPPRIISIHVRVSPQPLAVLLAVVGQTERLGVVSTFRSSRVLCPLECDRVSGAYRRRQSHSADPDGSL